MSGPDLNASRWAPGGRRADHFYSNSNNSDYNSSRKFVSPSKTKTIAAAAAAVSRSRSTSPHKTTTSTTTKVAFNPTKSQRDLQDKQLEFSKFNKLLRRLKWKSTILFFSFQRVFQHIYNEQHSSSHGQNYDDRRESGRESGGGKRLMNQLDYHMPAIEAETMFKIDFFEFYVLLERVLVHLLGTFGILVSAAYGGGGGDVQAVINGDGARVTSNDNNKDIDQRPNEKNTSSNSIVGDSLNFFGSTHRFHANVLSALDVPSSPLFAVLGTGQVRDYLGIAKEFRNRWKDAEDKPKTEADDGLVGSRYEKLLKDLKVEAMLEEILVGVEKGGNLAGEYLIQLTHQDGNAGSGGGLVLGQGQGEDNGMMQVDQQDERPWEAMPDAMDID